MACEAWLPQCSPPPVPCGPGFRLPPKSPRRLDFFVGDDADVNFPSLPARVVVVDLNRWPRCSMRDVGASKEDHQTVADLLQKNLSKIKKSSPTEGGPWTDEDTWDKYGEACGADVVVGIDLDLAPTSARPSTRARRRLRSSLSDLKDDNKIVYESLRRMIYPPNMAGFPVSNKSEAELPRTRRLGVPDCQAILRLRLPRHSRWREGRVN